MGKTQKYYFTSKPNKDCILFIRSITGAFDNMVDIMVMLKIQIADLKNRSVSIEYANS